MFAIAIYFYPLLPEKMAIHFSAAGIPNGFIGKFWGIFVIPVGSLVLYGLLLAIPRIDPLKKNIQEFRPYYNIFVFILLVFLLYLEIGIILWNVGIRINMLRFVSFLAGVLYVYIGILLLKSKRNWFVGIRTPWTLSNDAVWEKTNRLGGRLFIINGIMVVLSFFTGKYIVLFMVWITLGLVLFLFVYSYFVWLQFTRREENL